MNAYQRVFYGSTHSDITLVMRRNATISAELQSRIRVVHAPFENRWLFLLFVILYAIYLRFSGCKIILSEPSGFAAVGFVARYLAGYFWVLDVWDRPRWRTGAHEDNSSRRASDRFVFWLMKHANLYLLSVLPQAAKDIQPAPQKCIQLYNAIDPDVVASSSLDRTVRPSSPLQVAYGRSHFWDTMGLDVVLDAVRIARQRGCEVVVHLIGRVPDAERQTIERSDVGLSFKLHGFVEGSRAAFFRTVDVGLVPYMDYEDLKYIFPIKVLEHLSQANPVIASRLPGLAAMIEDGYNGILFSPGDPHALADAFYRLQKDPVLYSTMSRQALSSAARFDTVKKNKLIFESIFKRTKEV